MFVSPVLDRFAINGDLNAEGGATVLAALAPLTAPAPGDTRTPGERRADALVELARRALAGGGLPESGSLRPHVTVTVDLRHRRGQGDHGRTQPDPGCRPGDPGGAGGDPPGAGAPRPWLPLSWL